MGFSRKPRTVRVWLLLLAVLSLVICYYWYRHRFPLACGNRNAGGVVSPRRPIAKENQVVLVTGAAGFIGFHVAKTLATEWGARVVALDTFNAYYDVQLKKDRASILVRAGADVYRGDVCDQSLVIHLFQKYNFTGVIHLAAQAGVRHSMEDPLHYLNNNVRCFGRLLEILKTRQHVSLVYASSSSVYGHHSPLPFSPSTTFFAPSNVYAASKISNENFADVFCSQYGLSIVGLRFFTVYGPWGRPDMAVSKFAESIYTGSPLTFFKSTVPVGRDFTYVSDIVNGVLLALLYSPSRCAEVYNLGFGHTVDLVYLLKLLEKELQMTAKVDFQPLPPSDMAATLADISETRSVLGYNSRVNVEEGVKEFVKWFKEYKSLRAKNEDEQRNKPLEEMLARGERERAAVQQQEVDAANSKYRERIGGLKEKYRAHAEEIGEAIPSDLSHKEFIFRAGMDSPGSTIIKGSGYQGNVEMMKKVCQRTEQCVGFNTNGEFKSHLKPASQWVEASSPSAGLYYADINMCATDLHHCSKHQGCKYAGPSNYSCSCQDGYAHIGAGCVTKYEEGVVSEVELKWQRSDYFDGVTWQSKEEFVFFQGLDSPGGDYLLVEGGGVDVKRLEKICREKEHCLAFNTNGLLKHSLRHPSRWTQWTNDPAKGMYVLDTNYCKLDREVCPSHSSCHRFSPGNYSCKCDSPFVMTPSFQCKDSSIHIVMCADTENFPGVLALLASISQNTHSANRLKFHLVLAETTVESFWQYLRCFPDFPHDLLLDVKQLDSKLLAGRIHVPAEFDTVGNLSSLANFARFFIHDLFPDVNKAIYLDTDTVVKVDIADLWEQLEASDELFMAVPRSVTYASYLSPKVSALFNSRYGKSMDLNDLCFNAGVYGVNLDLWRDMDIHREVLYWMDQQAKQQLWRLGTQPILFMVTYGHWSQLAPVWNQDGLGWDQNIPHEKLDAAKILHWTGKFKPWMNDGLYRDRWAVYTPVACSGRGTCLASGDGSSSSYACKCEPGYSGEYCRVARS